MSSVPAARLARRTHRLAYMPRWLRAALTLFCFFMFFSSTVLLGGIMLPFALMLRGRLGDKKSLTRRLNSSTKMFSGFMRDTGLIAYWPPTLPKSFEGRGCLIIANHPSLIDVVLTLASMPELTCVARAGWYDTWLMGGMLRRTAFIPGPGFEGDSIEDEGAFLRRMEDAMRDGAKLLVFPEGTRSGATQLRRFGRGAIEAAIRAEVPILPLFIDLSEEFLMKGVPAHHVPPRTPVYNFEWFDPIETRGAALDSKALTKELQAHYQARFSRVLEARADNSRLSAG